MEAATPILRADARRNRERIVAAAREAFAARGVETRMADVAAMAGVGNGTVFRHFPTKQDLVVAVVLERMGELEALGDEALDDPDPTAGLWRLLEEIAGTFAKDSALKEMAALHFEGSDLLRERRNAMLERLTTLVARCQAAGTLRDDVSPVDFVVLINGVAQSVRGLEDERPGLFRRYLALALAGMHPRAAEGCPALPQGAPTPDDLDAAWAAEARARAAGRGEG